MKFEAGSDTEITWSQTGTLPKGLKFDKSSAVISGMSIKNGTYTLFTIKAKNKAGTTFVPFTITITGENPVKAKIATSKLKSTTGKYFSEILEFTDTTHITKFFVQS